VEEGFSPSFHPITVRWFAETFGRPTEVQTRTWERIATGTHLLVSAPTGSGKTLAAFLWPLDRLISGAWEGTGTRVLYVSPLKALNTDIRENLLLPLKGISEAFREAGAAYRQVTVAVRSGDTGQPERRRLLSHPPDILITTPESLNILLSTLKGQALLGGLRLVILDEIHGIVDNKRGTHLITAVERLVLLSGEFQRIGISATMNPMEEIARFLGGSRPETIPGGTVLRRRVVEIVDVPGGKAYDIGVMAVLPEFGPADWMKEGGAGLPRETAPPREPPMEIPTAKEGYWGAVAEACVGIIRRNLSTLFFANSRRMAEKITRLINEVAGETLAYSHHGSLSRELRTTVEKRFREGALRAIVATSSLEMGIDIGNLDEVVLIQAPPSVSSGLQRAGRAGHGVGRVSRVRILPLHGMDLVVSGVAAAAMARAELERIRIPEAPLDVLAQVILSITLTEPWRPDDLYDFIRRSSPYENLTRAQFDSVIGMLAGRYERARIRELSARISVDGSTGMITARPGAASLLFLSGGTIADRGYYAVRLGEAGSKMGELDEEFVWERKEGDRFSMGNRAWKIQRITDRDVEVVPVRGGAAMPPFWRGEVQGRSWSLSERIGEFMEEMDRLLELEDRERDARDPAAALASGSAAVEPEKTGQAAGAPEFPESPALAYAAQFLFDEAGRAGVVDFLRRQRIAAGCGLPCRGRIVAEWVSLPDEGEDSVQLVLHTLWGGRINRPLSMILAQALEEREGVSCEYFSDDNAILLLLPEAFPVSDLFALLSGRDILALLRKRLEATGIFGARFRENAGRALLLPRKSFSARMPLWLTRQKAKRLFRAVSVFPDFPITAETWRTCLADEFDLARLGELLEEVAAGTIELTETITSFPSPMANGIVYQKVNDLMYRGDDQKGAVSSITDEIIGEIAASDTKRLRIPTDVVGEFEGKKRRTAPGYVPADERELLDLAVERIVMTVAEWEEVTAVCASPEARAAGAVDARAAAPVSAAGASAARSPEDVSAAGASIPAGSSDFRISP